MDLEARKKRAPRAPVAGCVDGEIHDVAVMDQAGDANVHHALQGQRMKRFREFCLLPESLPFLQCYTVLRTNFPIRRRILYHIFKHDGKLVDDEARNKILERYMLPDLEDEDEAGEDITNNVNMLVIVFCAFLI